MAVGCAGVVRELARFANSFCVFAAWSLAVSATGPGKRDVNNDLIVSNFWGLCYTYHWQQTESVGGWQQHYRQMQQLKE